MLTPLFFLFRVFYYFISYGSDSAFVCFVALDLSRKPSVWVFVVDSAVMPMHSLYCTALSCHKHHRQIVSLALQGISQLGDSSVPRGKERQGWM